LTLSDYLNMELQKLRALNKNKVSGHDKIVDFYIILNTLATPYLYAGNNPLLGSGWSSPFIHLAFHKILEEAKLTMKVLRYNWRRLCYIECMLDCIRSSNDAESCMDYCEQKCNWPPDYWRESKPNRR